MGATLRDAPTIIPSEIGLGRANRSD